MSTRHHDPRGDHGPKGWRVPEWAERTTLSSAYVRLLIKAGKIRSVKAGTARIILTPPLEYLEALAADSEAA
jgi:hypothetical protein